MAKKTLLFIGALPPPYYGVLIQNERLLKSEINVFFDIVHVDISDHRDLGNIGKLDFENIIIGVKNIIQLIKALIRKQPDLVYLTVAHNNIGFLRDASFIILSKLLSKARIIIHCRSGNYYNRYRDNNLIMRMIMDLTYKSCDACIVLGKNLINMMKKWFSDDCIFVIPNGTSFEADISKKKEENGRINLGYLGFFGREKGTDFLLQGFKMIADKYSNTYLYLAGEYLNNDKLFKEKLESFINNNSLKDRVIFCGVLKGKEKQDFLLNLDIFLFPSAVYPFWVEGHPNAILEAMAASLPIIATDAGAISESVRNGYNGYLIKDKDANDIFLKTSIYIDDVEERKISGMNSYKWQKKDFNDKINTERIINVFNKMVNHN